MENLSLKQRILITVLAVSGLLTLFMLPKIFEDVDAGEIVVIQDAFDGELHIYKEPGFAPQMMGKVTHYRKSNQFWFNAPKEKGETNLSIPVKWNDGGHASISGSVRYDLPLDNQLLIKLHSTFGSQEAVENQLIKTNIEKSVFMTGPLMSSKESYAEKRNDLIYYIEDQASKGVYKTKQTDYKEKDQLTNEDKLVTKVEIVEKSSGVFARQEDSPIQAYGVKLYNISIDGIFYDETVEKQIKTQQQAIMNVQTAIANAKRAEQDAITTAKQGEADAAKAKWEQEVIKAKIVTEAEAKRKVAELEVQTAELNAKRDKTSADAEAYAKQKIMVADGALEKKLDAWKFAEEKKWEAFGKFQGNMVPMYQSGSSNNGNAMNWMEIMGMKAAKDLNLDLKTK